MDKTIIIDILKKEIERSTGCTDPGAVALAVATATSHLGEKPESIKVTVSPNVFKNSVSVGIPATGKRGIHLAAALGVFLSPWTHEKLAILDHVEDEIVEKAQMLLKTGQLKVEYINNPPDPLYVKAEVFGKNNNAWTIIQKDYSNIFEVGRNNKILNSRDELKTKGTVGELITYKVKDIIDTIYEMNEEDLEFLIEDALINKAVAEKGLNSKDAILGPAMKKMTHSLDFPFSGMMLGKAYTAAAAEGRMVGMDVPIMAIVGSGNHGITNFLGVLAAAETLKSSKVDLARALAISSCITVYIKGYIKRMTAFCGCSVAAATGVAAGTVYLLGGKYEDMVKAMNMLIGALAGIVCDGAKESCAYKLSVATATAIEYAYLVVKEQVHLPCSMGIIANEIEDTFKMLGKLNNPGMTQTDKCLLEIIEENQSQK